MSWTSISMSRTGIRMPRACARLASEQTQSDLIEADVQMTIAASYEVIMIGKYGATLGKMAAGIRVISADHAGAPREGSWVVTAPH